MLRKLTLSLMVLFLMLTLYLPAAAQTNPFIVDEAGLLTEEQISNLENMAADISDSYGIHAVVLTVNSLGGTQPQDYADDYYDHAGYGDNGVLFLLAMAEREWYISTCGTVIYALTDYGIQQVGKEVVSFFGDGLWYEGFQCFLNSLPYYLDALENGASIDGFADYSGDYYHGDQEEIVYYEEEFTPSFLFSLLCGIIVSGVVILIMRLCMNTKRPRRCASEYLKEGSWNLIQHHDLFLYSNVTKTRKQDPPKNSGGGSSIHRSSSGRSHGGGGGKF